MRSKWAFKDFFPQHLKMQHVSFLMCSLHLVQNYEVLFLISQAWNLRACYANSPAFREYMYVRQKEGGISSKGECPHPPSTTTTKILAHCVPTPGFLSSALSSVFPQPFHPDLFRHQSLAASHYLSLSLASFPSYFMAVIKPCLN